MNIANKAEDTKAIAAYIREVKGIAYEIGNRGPIKFKDDATLHQNITDACWSCSLCAFEGVLSVE